MLLLAVLPRDNLAATTALALAFGVDESMPRAALQRDLGRLMALHLAATPDFETLIADLFELLGDYGISAPGDVAGTFRTIASRRARCRRSNRNSTTSARYATCCPSSSSEPSTLHPSHSRRPPNPHSLSRSPAASPNVFTH